ncbi:MAG: PD40 domain-containing protein [Bacteroidales bacterium]|nr:PD40 domain-containing protein [Bacteroidales bacterium]
MKRWIPFLATLLLAACTGKTTFVDELPAIYPDYIGVTIPAGIAPLNFNLPDGYDRVFVRVTGSNGGELKTRGRWADFPVKKWHRLTARNAGGTLHFTVLGRKDGSWTQWRDFILYVSDVPLDEYGVTYRKIAPGYTTYSTIGIYQRDIHTFREEPIIESTLTPGQCMNCHTANATDPSQFLFHLRGAHGATLIQKDGVREWVTTKTDSTLGNVAYCYWHPDGRWFAGSINPVRQSFWTGDQRTIEVFDLASDLVVMDMNDYSLVVDPRYTTPDYLESSPAFTPDGKTLYFCKAKAFDVPRFVDSIRYDLMRTSFDAETGALGEIETVIPASREGHSIAFPRPSYDGRWLMYNQADFGVFPISHKEADLWLMDLQTGETRPIDEVNSPFSESFHNWSGNSRWFLFSSRREDGLYVQVWIASIDENGHCTKPFVLPQKNPRQYYHSTLYSFNAPDFTRERVRFDTRGVYREVFSDERIQATVKP